MAVGFVIGLIAFIALVANYAGDKEGRDRYNYLERKRRHSGKKLPPDELAEWQTLARKFRW